MEYSKPHLTYAQQLAQLRDRGLECEQADVAENVLRTVGYYRFSAYAYPFRELLPTGEDPETPVQYRTDRFVPGASFESAHDLYRFDHKLRMLTFEGLRSLELTLRVRIAYVLGKRDVFGHVNGQSLNLHGDNASLHTEWIARYREHVSKARSKDFMKHFLVKYQGELPVWVAMEVIDFGSLSRLFTLLDKRDKNEIATQFGLNRRGDRLEKWLQHLNHVRNLCAHHARLWNAQMLYPVGGWPAGITGAALDHVATTGADPKVYRSLALLSYLLRQSDELTQWPASVRTHVRKFPKIQGFGPVGQMGFPLGWDSLDLWKPRSELPTG